MVPYSYPIKLNLIHWIPQQSLNFTWMIFTNYPGMKSCTEHRKHNSCLYPFLLWSCSVSSMYRIINLFYKPRYFYMDCDPRFIGTSYQNKTFFSRSSNFHTGRSFLIKHMFSISVLLPYWLEFLPEKQFALSRY